MRLEARLHMRQEMRLKLAPQIIQSIEILQLPLLELRDRIDAELLENPLLETATAAEESPVLANQEPPPGTPADPVSVPRQLPVLPLRDSVVFPGTIMPLKVVREQVRRVLEAALAGKADCIVSGDADLLDMGSFEGMPILRPAEFLARL